MELYDLINSWNEIVDSKTKHQAASVEMINFMLDKIKKTNDKDLESWVKTMVWWHQLLEDRTARLSKDILEIKKNLNGKESGE